MAIGAVVASGAVVAICAQVVIGAWAAICAVVVLAAVVARGGRCKHLQVNRFS